MQATIVEESGEKIKIKIQDFCPTTAGIWNYYQFAYFFRNGSASAVAEGKLSLVLRFFFFVVVLIR